jgi:hypothetical protein
LEPLFGKLAEGEHTISGSVEYVHSTDNQQKAMVALFSRFASE